MKYKTVNDYDCDDNMNRYVASIRKSLPSLVTLSGTTQEHNSTLMDLQRVVKFYQYLEPRLWKGPF